MQDMITSHFPNAQTNSKVVASYLAKIQTATGITDVEKILLALSGCADEINVLHLAFEAAGVHGTFFMGGLAGMPFTGLTGVTAYAHHVPDNGVALITYGSHIGINSQGKLSKVPRHGMSHEGTSCGALMLALSRFEQNPDYKPTFNPLDAEQMLLEETLLPVMPTVLSASDKPKAAVEAMFTLIEARIRQLIEAKKSEFHCSHIVLLGGVMINTPPEQEDYFDPRTFEVIKL